MVDNAKYEIKEWFQVTENVKSWENQIRKLKEELSELSEGEIDTDIVRPEKVIEEILNKA